MPRFVVLAALGFLFATASCFAQSSGWVVRGVGGDSCAKYLGAVHGGPVGTGQKIVGPDNRDFFDSAEVYAGWLQGYLSGLNSVQSPGSKQIAVDYAGVQMWITNWCQERPASRLYEAAAAFARSQWQSIEQQKR